MKLWLAQVIHKCGHDVLGLFKTKDKAIDALYNWVEEYRDWGNIPRNKLDAIDAYFSQKADEGVDYEYYTLDEVKITE